MALLGDFWGRVNTSADRFDEITIHNVDASFESLTWLDFDDTIHVQRTPTTLHGRVFFPDLVRLRLTIVYSDEWAIRHP